jgi:anaerobic ribonucleoside-triphosphate reductase
MEKIPTAEEVIAKIVKFESTNDTIECTVYSLSQVMIEFAKLHVKAALKAASEKTIDKNSILNSYSLDNIK